MNKIGVLLDSTTYTRKELSSYNFIKWANLKVIIDEKEFLEKDISKEQMENYLEGTHKLLTSQPSPQDFIDIFKEFEAEGYTHVLTVLISEKLSGTYQSALLAKSMMEDTKLDISIHSPKTASYGVANGINIIAEEIKNGKNFDEILDLYYKIFKEPLVTFTLSDLMHLFKGGRLNRVSALIGTILRIKPIIEMLDGKLELVKKTRTNSACLEIFIEKINYYAEKYENVHVDIIDLNLDEWSQKIEDYIKKTYPKIIIHRTNYVSPVFYVHLGKKGFGIAIVGY
ncbi:MAG: DegV family protein [Candidatus Izemoplasmatales bacterium]|nr:DegV family protein [Candidatus Izemoplasmatales bacterium]